MGVWQAAGHVLEFNLDLEKIFRLLNNGQQPDLSAGKTRRRSMTDIAIGLLIIAAFVAFRFYARLCLALIRNLDDAGQK